MLSAFARALAQLSDPALRRPLLVSLALAAVVFALLWVGLGFLAGRTRLFETWWLNWAVDALGGLLAVGLTFVLFPTVAAAILSLFLDQVIAAVEARYYPGLPPARPRGFAEQIGAAARFLGLALTLNLLALPFYFVPALNLLVFAGVNGYLLGREYFEMVAPRRLDREQRLRLWRRRRPWLLGAGVVFALASSVPLLNLAAPVFAVAAMTHLVEAYR